MKVLVVSLILSNLLSWANSGSDQPNSTCEPLSPGESLLVQQDFSTSPTGIPRLYQIERDSESSDIFHIFVPMDLLVEDIEVAEARFGEAAVNTLSPIDALEFINPTLEIDRRLEKLVGDTEGYANFIAAGELQASMFNRARRCLLSTHGNIIGPDGEDLRLYATTSSQMNIDSENLNRIRISPSPHRSTSDNWAEDIECHTIVHEVLHLLGLVDGYQEQEFDFSCRHIEPQTSVMAAINAIGPFYNYISCPALDDQSNRPQILRFEVEEEPLNCFGDSKAHRGIRSDMLNLREATGSTVLYEEVHLEHPILHRAHVRFITKPFCNQENIQYITCAQNATRSENQGCIQTPDYCTNGSYLDN